MWLSSVYSIITHKILIKFHCFFNNAQLVESSQAAPVLEEQASEFEIAQVALEEFLVPRLQLGERNPNILANSQQKI